MKYKILLPLLVSVVIFNACSKDDNKASYQGDTVLETYYPGTTMEIKELSIYTKDGVVTDPELIQSFIDRNVMADARSSFYVGKASADVQGSAQALQFLNDSRVNYNGVNMQITGYQDSLALIAEYTATPFPSYTSTCGLLLAKVPAYTPFTDCPSGNCASYRKASVLIKSGANYYVPMLTYAVVTNECAITPSVIPAINVVNSDLQSLLNTGDSVLIQYAKLPLIKKASN